MRRPTPFFVRTLSALSSSSSPGEQGNTASAVAMAGDEEGNPTPASYASPPRVTDEVDGGDDHVNRTESGISNRTSATARRDRVSVGSRMTRTIIVRPRELSLPSPQSMLAHQ